MAKNYYIILGIPLTASDREIKDAYRRLAKECHPDSHGGNSSRFHSIHEAYSILSDPDRRREYDGGLSGPAKSPAAKAEFSSCPVEPMVPPQGPLHSGRSYRFAGGHGQGRRPPGQAVEIPVTPEQARQGGRVRIGILSRLRCRYCLGTGGRGLHTCRYCRGAGAVMREIPVMLSFGGGIRDGQIFRVSLAGHGLPGAYLSVCFRLRTSS